jgi:hypothetical protein
MDKDIGYTTKELHLILRRVWVVKSLWWWAYPLGKGRYHELRSIVQDEGKL